MKKRILSLLLVIFMIVPAPAVFASETCTHDWSDWTEVSSPDCGHSGVTSRYCYNCDEEQRLTIPATGKHDWSDWWIVKKSTVFKTGTKKRDRSDEEPVADALCAGIAYAVVTHHRSAEGIAEG